MCEETCGDELMQSLSQSRLRDKRLAEAIAPVFLPELQLLL
jgi:hypothetical protein